MTSAMLYLIYRIMTKQNVSNL